MSETQLIKQIEVLRSRITQHQAVLINLEQEKARLELPPPIPPGASANELVEIFEAASARLDELEGAETASKELERRTAFLQAQLSASTRQLQAHQAETHRNRIAQDVLNAIAK